MRETWIWIVQIVELQKSLQTIPKSKQFPGNWTSKIHYLIFCVGVWVRGQFATNFSCVSKDAYKNSTSFDTNVVVVGDGANMVLNEKPTKNLKLRGLKLRRLRQNQISTPNYIYQNDQQEKIYTFGNFGRETPTHKAGAHAISKFWEKLKNWIPRELYQNIDIPRISVNPWISSKFLK